MVMIIYIAQLEMPLSAIDIFKRNVVVVLLCTSANELIVEIGYYIKIMN